MATFAAVLPSLDKPWFRRLIITAAVIGPVIYALIVNFGELDSPPAWDSAVTVSPAALTIVDLDFDVWEVAQLPSSPEGGPSTHATSIYTLTLAFLIWAFGAADAFVVAHITSIALVGGLTAATYLLCRLRASIAMSALAAATIGVLPVVVQQAADVYLDLPLAVLATFACWTACKRRFWPTAGLGLLAVAIKTSGVFILPLLLIAKPSDKSVRRHLIDTAIAGFFALIPFFVALANTHRFSDGERSLLDLTLIRSSAALLVMTIDVFIVLAIYLLVIYGRARSRNLDRVSQASLVLVSSFFAVHVATMMLSGTIAILPRYYIVILPAVLAALLPREVEEPANRPRSYFVAAGLIVVLGLFSIVNVRGDFYPLPDHDFYVAAERSTRAQDLLALQVEGTRQLAATGLPLLIERQVHFRLLYPGMGYVEETPEDLTSVFIDPPDELPERFAMLMERRYTNPLEPIEEAALEQGYTLEYTDLQVGPYQSELIIASR